MRSLAPSATAVVITICIGCGSAHTVGPPAPGDRELTLVDPATPDIGLKPGHQRVLTVRYGSVTGPAIAGEPLKFSIFGDPKGSTLSADAATTARDGTAAVELRAGAAEASFEIRVTAEYAAPLSIYVEISDADFGSLEIVSAYEGRHDEGDFATVEFLLYGALGCATLQAYNPAPPLRRRTASGPGERVRFDALPLGHDRGLLVLAHDAAGNLLASACIDMPADLMRTTEPLALQITLTDVSPRLAGSYRLTTRMDLPEQSAPLAAALAPWTDLSDCPRDPAELLLDCVIDARDPGDPLDCVITNPSNDTIALLAARGTESTDDSGCRGPTAESGDPSLEQTLSDIMQQTSPATIAALADIVAAATHTLSKIKLTTTLTLGDIAPTNASDEIVAVASHRLDEISFMGKDTETTYSLAMAALPAPTAAPLTVSVEKWLLRLPTHGFTLRYGLLARAALGKPVLAEASLPPESRELAETIAMLVVAPPPTDGTEAPAPGCASIEAIACDAAGLGSDCLKDACAAGLDALAAYLDSGFTALQGTYPDLTLGGETPMIDTDGDLRPDQLGDSPDTENGQPGIWTTNTLLLANELITADSATFTGLRE